jgi:ATP-binding cassette subfamily C protein
VGFVGYSGAGKSTLIDLLLGLLTPERGQITVDGRDIQPQLAAWQRHFGYVPQMIYLLDDSVRRNVAFGFADEDIEDPLVWGALATARLDQKFRSESRGLDTPVGENGVRLSGGERQRIGIARAVFPDPEILVFDEATSAVDQQTEREVVETINALRHRRTLIVVAHRLTSVVHCDRIYFMKDGTISDSGSFGELLSRNAEFRTMAGEDG